MKQKVALVLGSGGARGMAHVGVIEELESRGYEISSVAGTSMGAMVGGFYAAGVLEPFAKRMCSLTMRDLWHYMDLTISSRGFVKGDRIFKTIHEEFTHDVNIEDLNELPPIWSRTIWKYLIKALYLRQFVHLFQFPMYSPRLSWMINAWSMEPSFHLFLSLT